MQKRFSRGFYPLGSYTLSENIGDIDSNFSNAVPGVGNLGSARADRSPTHIFPVLSSGSVSA